MKLSRFDEKRVRILLKTGEVLEGEALYNVPEYSLYLVNREEESLEIDHWVVFGDEIKSITVL